MDHHPEGSPLNWASWHVCSVGGWLFCGLGNVLRGALVLARILTTTADLRRLLVLLSNHLQSLGGKCVSVASLDGANSLYALFGVIIIVNVHIYYINHFPLFERNK